MSLLWNLLRRTSLGSWGAQWRGPQLPIKACDYQCWHTPLWHPIGSLPFPRETSQCNLFLTAETKCSLIQSRTTSVSETSAVHNPTEHQIQASLFGQMELYAHPIPNSSLQNCKALRALAGIWLDFDFVFPILHSWVPGTDWAALRRGLQSNE